MNHSEIVSFLWGVEEAVLVRVRHMKFAPAGGRPVQVLFPFRFLPEM